MKRTVLVVGLLLIVLANFIMVYYAPYGVSFESFQNNTGMNSNNSYSLGNTVPSTEGFQNNTGMNSNSSYSLGNTVPSTEGFQNNMSMNSSDSYSLGDNVATVGGFQNNTGMNSSNSYSLGNNVSGTEGFSSYGLENAGGAKGVYQPMGQFDGVKLSTGNAVSQWRYTAPNEPLTGAEFVPGDDALFMFKNNQCKPECCGASFSCGGGCVCTTPQQRQYIAGRGGNRTEPEDGL
jgi:hypothetical protein